MHSLFMLIVLFSMSTVLSMAGFVRFNKPASDNLTIREKMYAASKEKLIGLLNQACNELTSKEGEISVYSGYASFIEFADHIKQQIELLVQYDLKESIEFTSIVKAAIQEIHEIFLPTSDWDDAGGSAAIANEILALLHDIIA